MTETYDGNGDYANYNDGASDFKRKQNAEEEENDENTTPISEKASEYIRELLSEKLQMDHKYANADRLLEQEIQKVQNTGKVPTRDNRYVDIYREKQIRVSAKVLVPVREHPKFNFVGKLLGPKGNSMKRLQEETMCKMAVLGRGSMKDRKKEEELRASLDPKYAHLNDDLHVEISALGPPAEAHARIAFALAEVRKYLIPDSNDVIRQEQLREMLTADGSEVAEGVESSIPYKRSSAPIPPYSYSRPPPPAARAPTTRTVMPAKTKILSILDRARVAMEESYTHNSSRFEESVYEAPSHYEYAHSHSHAHHAPSSSSRSRYEAADYEPEYRREYYRESPTYAVKPSSSSSTRSWKTSSSSIPSSRRHEESSSSSKHSSREARYRTSPYSRPTK